jgi:hypothetical protein
MALALPGCGHVALTRAGDRVRVTPDAEVVKNCEYVGRVEGRDYVNVSEGIAGGNALWRLMNAAGAMGADTVKYVSEDFGTIAGATLRGDAYRCRGARGR